jgi:hypothetical protein
MMQQDREKTQETAMAGAAGATVGAAAAGIVGGGWHDRWWDHRISSGCILRPRAIARSNQTHEHG